MVTPKYKENQQVIFARNVYTVISSRWSAVRQEFVYEVEDEHGAREMAFESEMTALDVKSEYKATITLDNNLAVLRVFENGQEVLIKHGHVFHDGLKGIVQAINYASKQAFFDFFGKIEKE